MERNALAGEASSGRLTLAFFLYALSFAVMADQTVKMVDPQNVPAVTWAWVAGLALAGWFASSAPNLANWVDGTGVELLRKRLEVLKGLAVALIAGFIAYLLALVAGTPNLLAFVGVLLAAYGGDKYMARVHEKRAPE